MLNEFARLGWNPKAGNSHRHPNPNPRRPAPKATETPPPLPFTGSGWGKDRLIAKIGALLAEAGRGWAYADGIARKMFRSDSLRFCDPEQLRNIVAALEYDKKRRAQRAARAPIDTA